jgi:hypothetical protein
MKHLIKRKDELRKMLSSANKGILIYDDEFPDDNTLEDFCWTLASLWNELEQLEYDLDLWGIEPDPFDPIDSF